MYCKEKSVYEKCFDDPRGVFFTEENFPNLKEKPKDVSGILQDAIRSIVKDGFFGNLYIPEGEYPICHTVKIPKAVRLIGYGKKRPVFVLPKEEIEKAFGAAYPGAHYMFWFIGEADCDKENPMDANAGTFYSAISNIDFRIEGTHPTAICVRAHFAQHAFISHVHFDLGEGLAGIFDVGNEMDNLTFTGGEYGIVCRMCSPGWPFVLTDSVFWGQRKAAVLSAMTGFTGIRLSIADTPVGFDSYIPGAWEKLYLEDCKFTNISQAAVSLQKNAEEIICKDKTYTLMTD